jgi:hypothetical protein
MATKSEFTAIGEAVLREWLQGQGYHLIPAQVVSHGLPFLEGHVRQAMLACQGGVSTWVSCHTKKRVTYNQKRRRHETGCHTALWEDYLAVQRLTGIRGSLGFVHVESAQLQLGFLDEIAIGTASYVGPAFPEPMTFFDLARFDWYSLAQTDLFTRLQEAAVPERSRQVWEPPARTAPTHKQGYLF